MFEVMESTFNLLVVQINTMEDVANITRNATSVSFHTTHLSLLNVEIKGFYDVTLLPQLKDRWEAKKYL